jgi:hypothetical protein
MLDDPGKASLLADFVAKVFWGDERKFSGALTRVARGDVRDDAVPRKNDHGPA